MFIVISMDHCVISTPSIEDLLARACCGCSFVAPGIEMYVKKYSFGYGSVCPKTFPILSITITPVNNPVVPPHFTMDDIIGYSDSRMHETLILLSDWPALTPSAPLALMPPPLIGSSQPLTVSRLQMQIHLHGLQQNTSKLRIQLSQLRDIQVSSRERYGRTHTHTHSSRL